MFAFLSNFLKKNSVDCFAPIALSNCRITRSYLLERAGISDGTVILLAIPYYTAASADSARNISSYAVCRDYHGYFDALFGELLPLLRDRFPEFRFAGFADHSPIDEVDAAARAGLGIIGENHLLITQKYSSYVFLGEIVTDAPIPCQTQEIRTCEGCGACKRACPAEDCGICLSALTQKKGELTEMEAEKLVRYGSAWGCDICSEVCPHTLRAIRTGTIYSPIPYFVESPTPHMTVELLDSMSDTEFARRAYAWRGRDPLRRNLLLLEQDKERKRDEC